MITELSEFEEDTVVLIFGDHFPQVEKALYEELHGGQFDTLDSQMKQYKVPFMIWANYDIEESAVECTSLNYLGRYLLESAGLELPPFYKFQKEMEQVVPAVNAVGYYSNAEGTYLSAGTVNQEENVWLEEYNILQYNAMFGKKDISPAFFGKYIPSGN